ncbi:unnamed protein product [Protopolystoma xenopodis]|uniref:Uncharacterized protein n=1 Tax=Protopolystoma xenopodis TaxID=117903 RepID=A0A448XMQ5_9PLAT|nr:unnamed protein product [Protopolystoma xenopodis]
MIRQHQEEAAAASAAAALAAATEASLEAERDRERHLLHDLGDAHSSGVSGDIKFQQDLESANLGSLTPRGDAAESIKQEFLFPFIV